MKKIVTRILLICMIISSFVIENVTAEVGLTEKQKTLLEVMDVFNDEYALDAKLTKAEFASMLSKISFADADLKVVYSSQKLPTDVDEFSDYANDVKALYSKGYIKVDNFGRFYPDKTITAKESISMVLRAMGYAEKYVKAVSKNDEAFAGNKKLTDGMTVSENSELNVYSAYVLIYNMLYCDISDLYSNKDGKRLYMSERLDLYEIKGIVDDDGVIAIDGKSDISTGYVSIDGEVFVNKSGCGDLVGQSVLGIYKSDRYEDENILLGVCENVRKNSVTTVLSYDITKFKDRTYYYEETMSAKERKIHIPKDAVVIYNEKALGLYDNFEDSMLLPDNGRLRFYDNNNDGDVDILRIENFNAGVVNSVDTNKEKVYINNSRLIDLADRDYIIEHKDGTLMEFSDIKKDNSVLYLESLDKSIIKLIVSDDLYSDIVISKEVDDVTTVLTETGAKYEISKYAVETCGTIEVGQAYKFYIDAFDRVAYYEKDIMPNEYVYGCIAKVIFSDELEPEEYGVKIFTQYGDNLTYKLAKKVVLIDEDGTRNSWKREELPLQLTYRGVVRFKVNIDNEIMVIELPHTKNSKPEKKNRLHYLIDSYTDGNGNDYYVNVSGDVVNYGGEAIIDSNTVVFHCPTEPTEIENYAIGGVSSFSNGVNCNLYAFGTDPMSRRAECVCLYEAFAGEITSETPAIVMDVSLVYDEEESDVSYKITLLNRGNTESDVYMKQDVYNNEVFATANGVKTPLKISDGDIIYYATKGKYIEKATIIYDADHTVKDEKGNTIKGAIAGTELSYFSQDNLLCNPFYIADRNAQNSGSSTAWKFYTGGYKILTGWVYSVEDEYIMITTQNPAYGYDPNKNISDGFITQVYSYGQEKFLTTTEILGNNKMKIRTGKKSDLKSYVDYGEDCSRIVWVQYLYANRFINIINN